MGKPKKGGGSGGELCCVFCCCLLGLGVLKTAPAFPTFSPLFPCREIEMTKERQKSKDAIEFSFDTV